MTKSDYYLFFQMCNGVGRKTFEVIKKVFENDLEKALGSSEQDWLALGFNLNLVKKIMEFKNSFGLEKEKEKMSRLGVRYLTCEDEEFPDSLKEIDDCPMGIFIRGKLDERDKNCLAVVGTRKITSYGREVTRKLTEGLVANGLTIVSGLARGVDGVAHRTALANGGRTIAVLGSAIDYIYPTEHKGLALDIIKNGAVISERPIGVEVAPGNFPARNRIVSGMSLGVLVTEGTSKSGSKITARLALEQGREVFAVPGPITSQMSEAPSDLIKMGAKLVTNVTDILEEIKLSKTDYRADGNGFSQIVIKDGRQKLIWEVLKNGNKHIDELSREVKMEVGQVMSLLMMMEMEGLVKGVGEGEYMRL